MTFCKAQQELLDAPLEAVFYGGFLKWHKEHEGELELASRRMSEWNEANNNSEANKEIKRKLGMELHEASCNAYEGKFKENR